MPVIDDRGRLFGKLNLIDAIVVFVALGLIPLTYGAFLLFRVPVPTISSVLPAQVTEGEPATLQITGEDLRPFLRAQIGTFPSTTIMIQSPTLAEIKVPQMPPGSYDLVLFDEGQELVRVPDALTIVPLPVTPPPAPPPPPPSIELRAVGEFIGVSTRDAQLIRVGLKLESGSGEPAAEVLAVGAPVAGVQRVRAGAAVVTVPAPGEVQVPALIRVNCVITTNRDCQVGGTAVAQDATIALPGLSTGDEATRPDQLGFMIREVPPSTAPTMTPSARADVQVVGEFFGLSQDDLRFVEVGSKFERWRNQPFAEVLVVGTPEPGLQRVRIGGSAVWTPAAGELRVPAIVRMNCVLTVSDDCLVDDSVLAQNATIRLPVPRRSGQVKFLVNEVRSADAPAVLSPTVRTAVAILRVRFVAGPEVLDVMNVGDVDVSGSAADANADGAVLTEVGSDQQMVTSIRVTQGLNGRNLQHEQSVLSFVGTVRVPVVFTSFGWSYNTRPVKVGAPFTFESISGAMIGWIEDMEIGEERTTVAQ